MRNNSRLQASKNSLIIDPFAGTGSLLVSCSLFGAHTLGSDIDSRVFRGKQKRNVQSNFNQLSLGVAELVRSDNANSPFFKTATFDAIVTDPPYGVRAGAKKSGVSSNQRTGKSKGTSEESTPTIIKTEHYEPDDVMDDLLDFAARTLVRLVRVSFDVL